MNDPRHPTPANPSLHPQPPRLQPSPAQQQGLPRQAPSAMPSSGQGSGQGSGMLRPQHVVQPHGAQPRAPQQPQPGHPPRVPAQPANPPPAADEADLVELSDEDDDSVALVEDDELAPTPGAADATPKEPKKIIKFDAGALFREERWKRTPTSTGTGPIRVKSFHGKVSEQGLEYIDHAINEFLDNHPEIEVKNVTSNVCMFDGKFRDFALIINVWY